MVLNQLCESNSIFPDVSSCLFSIFTIASRNQSLRGFLVSISRFHPPGVAKGFIKGEALRLLRTNSSHLSFEENMSNFKTRLQNRGYPAWIVEKHLSEIKFSNREMSLSQKNKAACKKILPFVTQYHPALPNLKDVLMGKWCLMDNQPQLRNIFKEPPIISYCKGNP